MNDTTTVTLATENVTDWTDCPTCDGTGGSPAPCISCDGTGKLATKITPVMVSQAKFDALQADYDRVTRSFRESVSRNDEWRTAVRDAIVGYATDNSLCTEGTNTFLDDLGLDLIEQEFQVTRTETYTVTVERSGVVTATDEDEARDLVEDDPDQADPDENVSALIDEQVALGMFESDGNGIEITDVEVGG